MTAPSSALSAKQHVLLAEARTAICAVITLPEFKKLNDDDRRAVIVAYQSLNLPIERLLYPKESLTP